MKRLSWKYIAGLVDGEGCIDITRHLYVAPDRTKRHFGVPRLRITLTEPGKLVLESLQQTHGGSLYVIDKSTLKNPEWTQPYTWTLGGKLLRPFLQNVTEHLVIKKQQARFSIWVIDNVKGKHAPESVRERLVAELKAMKSDPQRLSEAAAKEVQAMLDAHVAAKPWSRNHVACTVCGKTDQRHLSHGRCYRCWQRQFRNRKPTTGADAIVRPS